MTMIEREAMAYGLTAEVIAKVCGVLATYSEVEEAILYGSRAKGNNKPGSDIDLTLVGAALNLHLLNRIEIDIDDLLLPYTFDLSIMRQITNPALLAHIERVGKVFYRREVATPSAGGREVS